MKEAIDNQGNKVIVPIETLTNLVNGVYFLLTPEEEEDLNQRRMEFEKNKVNREIEAIRAQRIGAYGSYNDLFQFIYQDMKNGTSTFVDHIDSVNAQYPFPVNEK